MRTAHLNAELNELETEIIKEIGIAVSDLTTQSWPRLYSILRDSDNRKVVVSFAVEIDHSGNRPKVVTRIAFAERHKDERETVIRDPRQTEMPLTDDQTTVSVKFK